MKKRQKKLTAVILALSMLVPLPGMPAGALAQSRENTAGIRGYIAESAKEGYTAAESSLEGLEETEIADGQNLAEMDGKSRWYMKRRKASVMDRSSMWNIHCRLME